MREIEMLRVPSLYLLLLCVGLNAPFLSEKGVVYGENLIAKDKQSINAALDTLPRIQPTSTIEHKRRVDLVLFSPSNSDLASESFGEDIKITDPVDGTLLRALLLPGCSVRSLGFSQDGRVLAIGTNTGQVELWDMRTHQLRNTIPVTRWNIDAVAFSPDTHSLVCCGGDGTVQLWDVDSALLKQTLGSKGMPMSSLVFSCDSSLLATLNIEGKCCVWETKTCPFGTCEKTFSGFGKQLCA